MNDDDLRDQLRDQLAHWPIGSEAVGIDDARDMADALLPTVRAIVAEECTSDCPTCSGSTRQTVGMVCQTCGTDYAAA